MKQTDPTAEQLLHRCVAELDRCTEVLAHLEDSLIPIISGPMSAQTRVGLQDLDLLRQSIEDIAHFMGGLAHAMGGPDQIDTEMILRTVKLQSMRVRLGGGEAPARPTENFVEF